jgi:Utp13 specific WD40 associated domain
VTAELVIIIQSLDVARISNLFKFIKIWNSSFKEAKVVNLLLNEIFKCGQYADLLQFTCSSFFIPIASYHEKHLSLLDSLNTDSFILKFSLDSTANYSMIDELFDFIKFELWTKRYAMV